MNKPEETEPCPADHDGLVSLRLSAADIRALARQGFVSAEYRQRRGPYYKLRWRADGRQKVRYLGQDARRAEAVRALLDGLQEPQKVRRQLAVLSRKARRHLRMAKSLLAARARAEGYHYHGYTRRRWKTAPTKRGTHRTSGRVEKGIQVLHFGETEVKSHGDDEQADSGQGVGAQSRADP